MKEKTIIRTKQDMLDMPMYATSVIDATPELLLTRVPGGWLYRDLVTRSTCFVPIPEGPRG